MEFKYIFFGTPEFAAIVLEKLVSANMPPVAVVCNPDRPAGRSGELTAPPVKEKALELQEKFRDLKIAILQPEELDEAFAQQIDDYQVDLFVLAAYGKILPEWLVNMPPKGFVGVHPSLLPKYRGATPIQSVLLGGEKETGTTLFLLDEKVDHGRILAQKELAIDANHNYESLIQELAVMSGDLLVKTLPKYINKEIAPHLQDEEEATYTRKFSSDDAFVDLDEDSPEDIVRKVKALNPEPGVYTFKETKGDQKKRIKILDAEVKNGQLILKKIQYEGKKPQESDL